MNSEYYRGRAPCPSFAQVCTDKIFAGNRKQGSGAKGARLASKQASKRVRTKDGPTVRSIDRSGVPDRSSLQSSEFGRAKQ